MFSFNLFFQEKLLGAYDILDSVLYLGDTLVNQREKIFYFLKLKREQEEDINITNKLLSIVESERD